MGFARATVGGVRGAIVPSGTRLKSFMHHPAEHISFVILYTVYELVNIQGRVKKTEK